MKVFRLAMMCILQLSLLAGPSLAKRSYLDWGQAYFEPRDEVVTPHIRWAKPLAGGPIKVLFITNHKSTRISILSRKIPSRSTATIPCIQ